MSIQSQTRPSTKKGKEVKMLTKIFLALLQCLVHTCLILHVPSSLLHIDNCGLLMLMFISPQNKPPHVFFHHKTVKTPGLLAKWHSICVPVLLFYPLMRGCRKTSITRPCIQIWAYQPLGKRSLIPPLSRALTETDHLSTPSHSRLQRRDLSPHHAATQVAHTICLKEMEWKNEKNSGQPKGKTGECLP